MHIDAKDREFFRRIAKNRVDVSLQNPTQPVPDYYGVYIHSRSEFMLIIYAGEKIGSLHQYRQVRMFVLPPRVVSADHTIQWLRDQSKYRRKALLPEE